MPRLLPWLALPGTAARQVGVPESQPGDGRLPELLVGRRSPDHYLLVT